MKISILGIRFQFLNKFILNTINIGPIFETFHDCLSNNVFHVPVEGPQTKGNKNFSWSTMINYHCVENLVSITCSKVLLTAIDKMVLSLLTLTLVRVIYKYTFNLGEISRIHLRLNSIIFYPADIKINTTCEGKYTKVKDRIKKFESSV